MTYPNSTNLVSLFFDAVKTGGDAPFLWSKHGGQYRSQSWQKISDEVCILSQGLRASGIGPGDRVILISENRPNWVVADLAIMSAGAITVPAYATSTLNDLHYLLEHCGAKAAIVSTAKLTEKLLLAAATVTSMQLVVSMKPIQGATMCK